MTLFSENKNFYPTPKNIISLMWNKIPREDREKIKYICEGQAGAGHIVEYIKESFGGKDRYKIHCIEKDQNLVSVLRGKGFNVVGYDFLNFTGSNKYDLIIGNPPFDEGEKHLLKAIDIMFKGHIVYLLNAETIKNPCTNYRRVLVEKLKNLKADIEYLPGAFMESERKTGVEAALIYIKIDQEIELNLFDGLTDDKTKVSGELHEQKEIVEKNSIKNLVAAYNRAIEINTKTLLDYYKNYFHVAPYMGLCIGGEKEDRAKETRSSITARMQRSLNEVIENIRVSYWGEVLKLDKVTERMTEKKRKEFHEALKLNSLVDFTEENIRIFILNLIHSYEDILTDAVMDIFQKMTIENSYHENLHTQNIHYFNGWKTNQAYFVNQKVVLPIRGGGYDSTAFWDSWGGGRWNLHYTVKEQLNDIDKVMNYFDGQAKYLSIVNALNGAFEHEQSRKILSTYFEITVFKKGTMHLIFRDKDILRRFNVTACKGKSWLPHDYGTKKYNDLAQDEKDLVKSFESEAVYNKNMVEAGTSLFKTKELLQISMVPGDSDQTAA